MNFLINALPIEGERNPCEHIGGVEQGQSDLPWPHERVDKEHIPRERDHSNLGAVRIFEVDGAMLDVVAAPQKQFTVSVELERLGWLIHLVSSL